VRRRPSPLGLGVVACSVLLLTSSCSGTLRVAAPELTGAHARACAALLRALPARVADQAEREVQTGGGYAAAWGDPAIELRCGVPKPAGFDRFSTCQEANGVGWFIPDKQQTGRPVAVTMTTIGRAEYVEVRIPADYFPPPATMVDLAPAIKRTIRDVRPCV
jgi:hypothetical protein